MAAHVKGLLSAQADEALALLLEEVAKPEIATVAGQSGAVGPFEFGFTDSQRSRCAIAVNEHSVDDTKWLGLLILGLLTQLAIGVVHLDRPRAQLAAMLIFTAGLVSTLGLIAIHEWPFEGPMQSSRSPSRQRNRIMTSGLAP